MQRRAFFGVQRAGAERLVVFGQRATGVRARVVAHVFGRAHAQQLAAGVPPDMVRISVGLEHIDDILWDIDQALAQASA